MEEWGSGLPSECLRNQEGQKPEEVKRDAGQEKAAAEQGPQLQMEKEADQTAERCPNRVCSLCKRDWSKPAPQCA